MKKTKDTLTGQEKQRVEEAFAALLLSGNTVLEKQFAPDAPVRCQLVHAQKALRCYAQGSEVLESLQHIPFRSPYKNFRMALKGMVAFHKGQGKARPFFAKVEADSPFFTLISPYLHVLEDAGGRKKGKRDETRDISITEKKFFSFCRGWIRRKVS
ncbi:MAG: hypothetical protein ACL93V_10570 [Candidatus Electrothrix sp. YB6]